MKKIELKVITLGKPRVVVDGQEVQRKDWHCNLARLLFFLAVDVSPVRRNELAVHLWPNMSPRQVKLNFHTVRWQMNAALGAKNLYRCDELADNVYAFDLDRVEILHDTARFQHAVHEARAIARTSQNGAVITAWQKAIGLYGGDYLEGINEEWALRRRRKLSMLYQEALYRAAQLYTESGEQDDAVELYCCLVQEDEYDEGMYQHLANLIFR